MPAVSHLNHRQEAFVRHVAEGCSGRAAYERAGYTARGNAAEVNAARLLRNAQVAARLAELQAKHARRSEITVDTIVRQLEEARQIALAAGQASAAVQASMGVAKVLGLVIDHSQVDVVRPKPALFPVGGLGLEMDEAEWLKTFRPRTSTEH